MPSIPSHLKLALASVKCFSDDGTLDLQELNYLLGIALADNVIDDEEKRVLSSIFGKVNRDDVRPIVWDRIVEIRKKYQL